MNDDQRLKICALAGGVGGARLVDGFYRSGSAVDISVIVNIGDDFEHFGLWICPDLDTVCYTLAELANPETGWGLKDETLTVSTRLEEFGAPTWFKLGDRDLATHLERTRLMAEGVPLSQITQRLCDAWGVKCPVMPVSDDICQTIVHTEKGSLSFQEYFVRERCEPAVTGFEFKGADIAKPAPGVLQAIREADAVVFCPSNPWVSIDPILAIDGVKDEILKKQVVAVSPIIGGKTVKGPAAKMYREMGIEPSALAVANHYKEFEPLILVDDIDIELISKINDFGVQTYCTDILIKEIPDRIRLANEIFTFI